MSCHNLQVTTARRCSPLLAAGGRCSKKTGCRELGKRDRLEAGIGNKNWGWPSSSNMGHLGFSVDASLPSSAEALTFDPSRSWFSGT
ncbi:hypothetical protein E3N88_29525 [Mikania micrantha]|uniref:Uncharacterized protein n=1 Tax=Mikania micrantha TaxID=192012 RepID=A0A5N6MJS9_9ASTR|nr:hypothetical protein E3N88_29525 [Mikania micrantha]